MYLPDGPPRSDDAFHFDASFVRPCQPSSPTSLPPEFSLLKTALRECLPHQSVEFGFAFCDSVLHLAHLSGKHQNRVFLPAHEG